MMRAAILVAAFAALPLTAGAAIYRWVDESGRVHYSNFPPDKQAKNVKVVMEDSGPSASAVADAEREAARRREEDLLERLARLEQELAAQRQQQYAQVQYYPAPVPPPPPDYYYGGAYYYPSVIYSGGHARGIHGHRHFLPRPMPVVHGGGMRRR